MSKILSYFSYHLTVTSNQIFLKEMNISKLDQSLSHMKELLGILNDKVREEIIIKLTFLNDELNNQQFNENSHIIEQKRIQDRMNDFDIKESRAYKEFERRGWNKLPQTVLKSIAQVIEEQAKISLDRESKRRRTILIKWFDDHFDLISPFLNRINLVDE